MTTTTTSIKGIRKAVSEANRYNCWVIFYNPTTNEVVADELISLTDEPNWGAEWTMIGKGDGYITMAYIKDAVNEASYQW